MTFLSECKLLIMKRLIGFFALLIAGEALFAQVTTSSMSGKIIDNDGEMLVGATVVATHTPSGTVYGAVANTEGRYAIQGMRVGGPYTIDVRYVGFAPISKSGVILKLGDTYQANFEMIPEVGIIEIVDVVANATKKGRNAATTTVSTEEISLLPSASRSITDLTKLSPYANGINFAGSDGRATNLTIDGANFNNNYGLHDKLPGGGNPISIDAIDEIQIVIAPFDVRQSNFVGGGINAITKSGTNSLRGSAYFLFNNQKLRGNRLAGVKLGDTNYSKRIIGVTLGGPIVKNKLFFFANFEKQDEPRQTIMYCPSSASAAQLDLIREKLQNDFGYDPGSYDDYPGGLNNTKLLARLDWNIHQNHKMTIRFNSTSNKEWFAPDVYEADDNFVQKSYNRSSRISFPFSKNMYQIENKVKSFAAEYNARFGNSVSNQLIVTYTDNEDVRSSDSDIFPHFDVMSGDYSSGQFIPFTSFGKELFIHNNQVINKIINATDNVTIFSGNHKITAGINWERQTAENHYMRSGTGYYRFASVDDFLSEARPLSFSLTYGNNGKKEPFGAFTYQQLGVYVQDDWYINDLLKLNYGVRLEGMFYDDSQLITNNAILNHDLGGRSINTGKWPGNKVTVSPRVGFSWNITDDNSLTLRGGSGFFQGRLPLVFFVNMPQNAGMIQTTIVRSGKLDNGELVYPGQVAADLDALVANGLIVNVEDMISTLKLNTTVSPEDGQLPISIIGIDTRFKMPRVWKTLLAFDYVAPTPFPLSATIEGMLNKTINGVCLENWNLKSDLIKNAGVASRFAGVDNRVNYRSFAESYQYGETNAYILANTNKGYGYTINLSVKAEPIKKLSLTASYTITESKEVSSMPGCLPSEIYNSSYCIDGPDFSDAQRSTYVVPHRISGNITYSLRHRISEGDGLKVGIYFSANSASAYSYAYSNDMNGDGLITDLMYIPRHKNELNFKTEADRDAFWTFVEQDNYLSRHKGEYAEANAARSPWVSSLDIHLSEDFGFKVGKTVHHIEVSANIDNSLNMFDSHIGVKKFACYGSKITISPLKYEGVDENNTPVYSMNKVKDSDGNMVYPTQTYNRYSTSNINQCWSVLLGIKYRL